MNKIYILIAFLMGILIGIFAWNIISFNTPVAYANGASASGSANGYIAVTGLIDGQRSGLWIIDTKETDRTPSVCLYIPGTSGRGLSFAGARRIKYDNQVIEHTDTSATKYKYSKLRAEIKELEEKEKRKQEEEAKKQARKKRN